MLVVDASALVALIIGGPQAESVGDVLASDGDWWGPEHVTVEVANALRGLWLGGALDDDAFRLATGRLAQLTITTYRTVALLARMIEFAGRVTAYDAAHVALAETLDCPLVTVDRRLRSVGDVSCRFLPAQLPAP